MSLNELKEALVEEKLTIPESYLQYFPDYSVKKKGDGHDKQYLHQRCSGGKRWAFFGLLKIYAVYALYPFFSYHLAECQEHGMASTIGKDTPMVLTWWLVIFPLGVWLQSKCLQYVLGEQLSATKQWAGLTLPLKYPLPCLPCIGAFWQWLLAMNIFSNFARQMGFMWNAEVLGMAVKTDSCPNVHTINELWETTMGDSILINNPIFRILGFNAKASRFTHWIVAAYLLQLAQPIFVFMFSWPRASGRKYVDDDYETIYEWTGTNDLSVLMIQADMACMDAVTDHATLYAMEEMKSLVEGEGGHLGREGHKHMHRLKRLRYLKTLLTQLERTVSKFALVILVQNVFTANVQTTLFAIIVHFEGWHLSPSGGQFPIFFNLIMCFIGTISGLGDIANFKQSFGHFWSHVPHEETDKQVLEVRHKIKMVSIRFVIYLVIYVGVTLWTLMKGIALFTCDSKLWNWGTGCVPE